MRVSSVSTLLALVVASVIALAAAAPARAAAEFASEVVEYVSDPTKLPEVFGSSPVDHYDQPAAALGAPDPMSGLDSGFPNVLSPFSAAYDRGQVVAVAELGWLTLKFAKPVAVTGQPQIGVISNVYLVDAGVWPNLNGDAMNPAQVVGSSQYGGGQAVVEVSADGLTWAGLGLVTFNMPACYFTDSGPYDSTPGTQLADFSKPFAPAGGVSAFDGLDYAGVLAVLDGSGGGTWLNLAGSGLSQVQFIRFSVPDDGQEFIDSYFVVDSVIATPEPASLALLLAGGAAALVRRRRGTR